MEKKELAVIHRQKHFNGYGKLIPFSWMYSVEIEGEKTNIGTRLGSAREWAKLCAKKVILNWEDKGK